ncbi:MAG: S1 RNA-binding domain-containing protein [Planctomycetota bacterium]
MNATHSGMTPDAPASLSDRPSDQVAESVGVPAPSPSSDAPAPTEPNDVIAAPPPPADAAPEAPTAAESIPTAPPAVEHAAQTAAPTEAASATPEPAATPDETPIEQQVNDAMAGQSTADLVAAAEAPAPADAQAEPDAGETQADAEPKKDFTQRMMRGRIAAIRGEDVFVDLQGEDKLQGVVPLRQFDRPPRIKAIMDFVVDSIDETKGLVYLSREGAVSRATWDQLTKGATVEARCVAHNKGGLQLEMVGGITAFMPASHIDVRHVGDLDKFVGQKLTAVVQEIDRKSKRVILSRKDHLIANREQAKAKAMENLKVGDVLDAKISRIMDYGAFADIGGVDGLIHVSDLAHAHVKNPADYVKVGEDVKVKVLKIDPEKGRIALGIKQVQPDPWEAVTTQFAPGGTFDAVVTRAMDFGAFIQLTPGVEGLCPIAELSWSRVHRVEDVIKAGDQVRVKVLNIDPARKRMTLSLKEAAGDPWTGAEAKYPPGEVVECTVKSTTDFGAFVELEPGIEGLVHISELDNRRVENVTDVLHVGDVKPFKVVELDETARKAKLSLKQADPNYVPRDNDFKPRPKANWDDLGGGGGGSRPKRDTSRFQVNPADYAPDRGDVDKRTGQPRRKGKKNKDLKSGLGDGGAFGTGLGDINLDDFK